MLNWLRWKGLVNQFGLPDLSGLKSEKLVAIVGEFVDLVEVNKIGRSV